MACFKNPSEMCIRDRGSVLSGSDHAVHQAHVHPLPFAGNGAGVDCGKDADVYMKSAQNITQRRTGTGRLSALGTGDGHQCACLE